MAIAFDAASSGTATGVSAPSSIVTVAHTVAAGSNTILVVCANMVNAFAPSRPSATYNGVSMTFAWEKFDDVNPLVAIRYISQFYLVNPASGTHNIVVTFPYPGSTSRLAVLGASFTGVNQATPIGSSNTALDLTGSTSTATVNITSAAGEVVIDDVFTAAGSASSLTANQTLIVKVENYASQNISSGTQRANGSASVTMSWACGGSTPIWMIGGMPLKPASSAAGPSINKLVLLGVGQF